MRGLFQLAAICHIWVSLAYGQFGFGGLGMGMGMGMGMGGNNMARYLGRNSFLARSIRNIVHPNAMLTPEIRQIAMRHRGPPSTRAMLLEYTPHFVQLGFQHSIKPNGTIGQPSYEAMEQHMVERAINYLNISGIINPAEMGNMHELLDYIKQQRSGNQSSTGVLPSPAISGGRIASVSGTTNQITAPMSVPVGPNQVVGPAYNTQASPFVAQTASLGPNSFLNNYMMMQLLSQNSLDLNLLGEMTLF